jgi:tetratricopeptide (TPR) repeat protein
VDSALGGALQNREHEHPTDAELEGLVQGAALNGHVRPHVQVVRHLLQGCPTCKDRSRTHLAPQAGYDYGASFAGAERALADFFATGRPSQMTPEILLSELRAAPEDHQENLVKSDRRFASVGLVDLLIESSHATRYKNTSEMLSLAALARVVADACTVEETGSDSRLADLKGRAWGHFGNSLRVCGQLREAEEAIATAEEYIRKGTADPPLRARLLEQKASLRTSQGRYPDAIELAEQAADVYREIGQMHNFATALVHKAIACQYAGEPENGITMLNQAIPLIDPEKNPHLLLAACHNLVVSYVALDKPEQALSLYYETRGLYKDFEDDLILLRAGWQEGQLLRDLGHLEAAETALLQARQGFEERNLAQEAALVSLDLAWVYVKLGRIEQLKQTVTQAIPIFQALRVGREAIAALLQLQHAEGQEQKALELIHLLNTRLSPLHRNTSK